MKCNKCGSENMTVQVVNENHYKKGHGCLFTVLFGIYYWTWLFIKWCCKWSIYLLYLVFYASWAYPLAKFRKQNYKKPEWISKIMRRTGKMYNSGKTYAVCQDCGHKQEC